MKYYSPSTNSFYDDAIFGTRQIDVIDETRQQAALDKARTKDDADFDAAVEAADPDGPQPIKSSYQRRQKAATADPIMKTVSNPNCRLPTDAVEVSDTDHAAMMTAQAEGREITVGTNGLPVATAPQMSAEQLLAMVRKKRDRALAASDWTQAGDSPLDAAKKLLWAEHRKALRDLPSFIEAKLSHAQITTEVDLATVMPTPPQ
jgi:hypothetical protein